MYVYCVYPAMSKKSENLSDLNKKDRNKRHSSAFHKCCQGCLLRGPRYIRTSFILVCALCCTQLQGTRKVYSQAEKFIRLVRIKQKFIRIAYLYSKCTDCRIKYSDRCFTRLSDNDISFALLYIFTYSCILDDDKQCLKHKGNMKIYYIKQKIHVYSYEDLSQ